MKVVDGILPQADRGYLAERGYSFPKSKTVARKL